MEHEAFDTLYMGLLRRGPAWTAEESPETEALQQRHLEYINKMAQSGSLLIAGPFTDDGDLRGVFLFQTVTFEEAQALALADPAVQAGRLVVDLHPWMMPAGILRPAP